MKAQDLNIKINEVLKERGFDKGENDFWDTIQIVMRITEDILNEIPDTKFYVSKGGRYGDTDDTSANSIYVYTNTFNHLDSNHKLCEIRLHRTKVGVRRLTRSRKYNLWAINSVTVKPFKDIEFEDEYKLAAEELAKINKEKEERDAKLKAELEAKERQYEIEATERAKKVLEYIKKNNLDINEFAEMSSIYHSHTKYIIKLINKESD